MTNSSLRYRPEIDGLRAIAVSVVVLFHAKLGCPGGYVGVDVFFVISGFLITSLLLRSFSESQFSTVVFWERRIRRIVPALTASMLATLLAGWFLLWPAEFGQLGRAMVAQSFMLSNVYHWRISGYFGPEADSLPILHTWSLAVEEQFYILFPLLLLALSFLKIQSMRWAMVLIGAVSIGLSIWMTPRYPSAAFFLLPTRAWELLMGSLIAAFPGITGISNARLRETISILGIAAIAYAVTVFEPTTEFPGINALIPCAGAMAFIASNSLYPTLSGRILAARPFVFIGKISYSLYLVHWPLFVYATYWQQENPQIADRLTLVGIAAALAVVSWLVIESPVRERWLLRSRAHLFSFAIGSLLLQAGIGIAIRANQGFPDRFDAQTLKYHQPVRDHKSMDCEIGVNESRSGQFRKIGADGTPVKCLLWGDSHAMSLAHAIERICLDQNFSALQATHSSTAPLLNFVHHSRYSLNEDAPEFNANVLKFAIEQKVPIVFMAGYWSSYDSEPQFAESVRETVSALIANNIDVVIVRDVPLQTGNVPNLLAKANHWGKDVTSIGVQLSSHREMNRESDRIFEELAQPHLSVIDPVDVFVDEAGICRAELDGNALYFDAQHLSEAGADFLIPLLQQTIQRILSERGQND